MSDLEMFQFKQRNQINIAICGPVSVGKSTLLNSIFVNTYSDMKMKRTTMTPQVYYEVPHISSDVKNTIRESNTTLNESLIKKTENGEHITMDDIKEAVYLVPKVHNLVDMKDNTYLSVYDIPGLNDARTKDIFYEYMDTNFYKFDIVIFVIDIYSGLNTSEEIEILNKILNNIKKNKEEHGVINKLIVLANKCDELSFNGGSFKIMDDELSEMYQQIELTVFQKVQEIDESIEFSIFPLSAEDSYIYRMYDRNPEYELDIKHINKFGYNEYGKSRWNRLSDTKKKDKIKDLMSNMNIEDTLGHTGFNGFKAMLNNYLNLQGQYYFLNNHLMYGLNQIKSNTTIDIASDINELYDFYQRYKEINKEFEGELTTHIVNIKIFNKYVEGYLMDYYKNVIIQYITPLTNPSSETDYEGISFDPHTLIIKRSKSYKKSHKGCKGKGDLKSKDYNMLNDITMSEHYSPIKDENILQIEEIKNQLEEMNRMFNGDCPFIMKLLCVIIDNLNLFYVTNITRKTKPIENVFQNLYSLVSYKFNVTLELIKNIFTNTNMKNKKPREIISYVEELESKKLISTDEKFKIICDFLTDIYLDINNGVTNQYIDSSYKMVYCYYANLYWSKLSIKTLTSLGLTRLAYYANINSQINFGKLADTSNAFEESISSVIILEYYLNEMIRIISNDNSKSKILNVKSRNTFRTSEPANSKTPEYSDGNISDDLNSELGLD